MSIPISIRTRYQVAVNAVCSQRCFRLKKHGLPFSPHFISPSYKEIFVLRFNLLKVKSTITDGILCQKEVNKPIGGSSLLCFGGSSLHLLVRAPANRNHHSFHKYFSVFRCLLDLSTVRVTVTCINPCRSFSNCTDSLH